MLGGWALRLWTYRGIVRADDWWNDHVSPRVTGWPVPEVEDWTVVVVELADDELEMAGHPT